MVKNALLSLAALLVTLLAGEAILALMGRFPPTPRLWEGSRLVPIDESDRPGDLGRALRRRSRILEGLVQVQNRLGLHFPIGHRWRLNRRVFEEIRDETERLGAALLVVYLPTKYLLDRPIPVFDAEFRDMRIPFLDLQARLPADALALYFEHDTHLNARGHAFAAARIGAALEERGWVR